MSGNIAKISLELAQEIKKESGKVKELTGIIKNISNILERSNISENEIVLEILRQCNKGLLISGAN